MSKNAQQLTKLYVPEEALGVTLVEEALEVTLVEDMEEAPINGNHRAKEVQTDGNQQAKDVPTDGREARSFLIRVEIIEAMEVVEDVDIPRNQVVDLMDHMAEVVDIARNKHLSNNVGKYHNNHAVLSLNKNVKRYQNNLAIMHQDSNALQ